MSSTIAYTAAVKEMTWSDFNFEKITIAFDPESDGEASSGNGFNFGRELTAAIENISKKKLLTLLFFTSDDVSSPKYYGIGYLETKEIFTVEVLDSAAFSLYFSTFNKEKKERLYVFSSGGHSSQPLSNFKKRSIFKQTGSLIEDFVPNKFIAEKLAKEKADFLNPFIQLEAKVDVEQLQQHLQALATTKSLVLLPPKNNEEMYKAFEAEAGFPFPAIVQSYLSLHDGFKNTAIMGCEKIMKEWRQWKQIYDDWTQEDLLDTGSTNEGKALLMYTTPYWIPFFDLGDGNFLAFDFAPNTKGKAGQIIQFGADQEIGSIEADDIISFLQSLMGNNDDQDAEV